MTVLKRNRRESSLEFINTAINNKYLNSKAKK